MVELADRLTDENPEPEQFAMLHGALHAAAIHAHRPQLVLASYMLRAMALSGWALAVFECAKCGVEGPHEAFHVYSGEPCATIAARLVRLSRRWKPGS